jgi:hypothetical protein
MDSKYFMCYECDTIDCKHFSYKGFFTKYIECNNCDKPINCEMLNSIKEDQCCGNRYYLTTYKPLTGKEVCEKCNSGNKFFKVHEFIPCKKCFGTGGMACLIPGCCNGQMIKPQRGSVIFTACGCTKGYQLICPVCDGRRVSAKGTWYECKCCINITFPESIKQKTWYKI